MKGVSIGVLMGTAYLFTHEAVAAGAKVVLPVKNQFWGDRTGRIMDPSGHVWTISSRVEETSSDERKERWSTIVKS